MRRLRIGGGRMDRASRFVVLGGLIVALAIPTTTAAANEPSGHASCMGIERAAISPPGSSDEIPGGSSVLNTELREIADALGVPPGAVAAFIAHLHAGSHEACDEALE